VSEDRLRRIADAVLYEGFVLWPYRRSALKNQKRWTFGTVFPRGWSEEHPDDPWRLGAEVLVEGDDARVDVRVRFLHVVRRQMLDGAGRPVDALEAGGRLHLTWEEATERELTAAGSFAIPAGSEREELEGGVVEQQWAALEGAVTVTTGPADGGRRRLGVEIENTTPWPGGAREDALSVAFCSTHAVLRVADGAFLSPLDPAAADCRQEGLWPCLVGEPPDRSTILASPIILDEYPQIAPESPGDLFDGGEIDELLILNVLALTDAERDEARASDPRVRELLERCEGLTPDELLRLHGAIR
jgi:hypothetical protein